MKKHIRIDPIGIKHDIEKLYGSSITPGNYLVWLVDLDIGVVMAGRDDCDKVIKASDFQDALNICKQHNDPDLMAYIIDSAGFVVYCKNCGLTNR